MTQTMRERFDEKFTTVWNSKHSEFIRIPDGIKGNMLDFIDQEISSAVTKREEELETLFPEHKGEMFIEHNGHKSNYETVENYIEWRKFDDDDFATPESKKKCIENDSIWVLQWYPNTPVGFNVLVGSSLQEIITNLTKE